MTLMPNIHELACAAHGDCALAAPEVFTIEDIAVVTGKASDEAILKAAQACPSRSDHRYRRANRRADLPVI